MIKILEGTTRFRAFFKHFAIIIIIIIIIIITVMMMMMMIVIISTIRIWTTALASFSGNEVYNVT